MAIDLGDSVRLSYTNTSTAGAPANGGAVTVTVTLPDATVSGPTVVAPTGTGIYVYDYLTVQSGRHTVRWSSTGLNPGAYVDVLDVRAATPPYLISLADAKAELNISSTVDDEEIRTVVEATTAAIERHLNRAVVRRTVVEHRDMGMPAVSGNAGVLQAFTLAVRPVVSLTSITMTGGSLSWSPATMDVTDAGVVRVLTGALVWGPVTITYEAGMTQIPAAYGKAARIVIQHLWQNQRGARGAPRPGMVDALGTAFSSHALPPLAQELLGPNISGIA
jgi:hypothetical protein